MFVRYGVRHFAHHNFSNRPFRTRQSGNFTKDAVHRSCRSARAVLSLLRDSGAAQIQLFNVRKFINKLAGSRALLRGGFTANGTNAGLRSIESDRSPGMFHAGHGGR